MPTVTVRLSGGGDYTSVGAACTGAGVGDTISITEAATYQDEVITLKANQAVVNNSGGVVTLRDLAARATYMIVWAAGAGFTGVTIEYGSNYVRCASGMGITGMYLTDCVLKATGAAINAFVGVSGVSALALTRVTCQRTGAGNALLFSRFAGCTGAFSATDCDFSDWSDGFGNAQLFANTLLRCRGKYAHWRAADANGTLLAQDCSVYGAGENLAVVIAGISPASVIARACASHSPTTGGIVSVGNGSTVGSLEVTSSFGPTLVSKSGTGTWTVGAGAANSYLTSALTGAGDLVVGATADWRLGPDYTPSLDSPLLERGVAIPGRVSDLNGRPAHQGRGPCIGPIQPQYQTRDVRTGRDLGRVGQRRAII